MPDFWSAKSYTEFLNQRTRPAKDLLSAIPDSIHPKVVYDLGCGPGNSTILLAERWPQATVIGIDSSSDMLAEAQTRYPHIQFKQQDIAQFKPEEKMDCLFANASLQWLDHHEDLIPQLLIPLNPGGVLAVQMPNNFHSLMHQTVVKLLQSHTEWQPYLKLLRYGLLNKPFYELARYYDLLTTAGMQHIQLWETNYLQEMESHQAIYDWLKGTGLRPVLAQMKENELRLFEEEYMRIISSNYLKQKNEKILMSYQRLFMIGFKII